MPQLGLNPIYLKDISSLDVGRQPHQTDSVFPVFPKALSWDLSSLPHKLPRLAHIADSFGVSQRQYVDETTFFIEVSMKTIDTAVTQITTRQRAYIGPMSNTSAARSCLDPNVQQTYARRRRYRQLLLLPRLSLAYVGPLASLIIAIQHTVVIYRSV